MRTVNEREGYREVLYGPGGSVGYTGIREDASFRLNCATVTGVVEVDVGAEYGHGQPVVGMNRHRDFIITATTGDSKLAASQYRRTVNA